MSWDASIYVQWERDKKYPSDYEGEVFALDVLLSNGVWDVHRIVK